MRSITANVRALSGMVESISSNKSFVWISIPYLCSDSRTSMSAKNSTCLPTIKLSVDGTESTVAFSGIFTMMSPSGEYSIEAFSSLDVFSKGFSSLANFTSFSAFAIIAC